MRAAKLVEAKEIEFRMSDGAPSAYAIGDNGIAYAIGTRLSPASKGAYLYTHKLGEGPKMSLAPERSEPPLGVTEVAEPRLDDGASRVVAAARAAGLEVRFFEDASGANGMYMDGTIWVNTKAKSSKAFVAGLKTLMVQIEKPTRSIGSDRGCPALRAVPTGVGTSRLRFHSIRSRSMGSRFPSRRR